MSEFAHESRDAMTAGASRAGYDGARPRRIVVCSTGVPHPTRGASVVLFYQYVRALVASGWRVLHVVIVESDKDDVALHQYEADLSSFGAFEVAKCKIYTPIAVEQRGMRLRVAQLSPAVAARIREFRADAAFLIDLASAALLRDVAVPGAKVVWLGDLTFDTIWYHNLYDAKERPLAYLKLPLTSLRCSKWRKLYRHALADASVVIASSHSSVAKLAALGVRSEYLPYPWPEATAATQQTQPSAALPSFLFFGTLSALGSRSAFRFLLDDVYPKLLKLWGGGRFKIFICGMRDLPEWVAIALKDRPEFEFKGFVDRLDDLARHCHAMLAPIDVPVGNRSRIVTAMAHGWPFVAHRHTALGNPALVSGENCLLANSATEFAAAMQRLVAEPQFASELAGAARRCYADTFEPTRATGALLAQIDAAMGKHYGMIETNK